MKKRLIYILLVILILLPAFPVNASDIAHLGFVETDVILQPSGKAIITYTVRYNPVPGKTMLAFTMDGFDKLDPVFDYDFACVVTDDDEVLGIDITDLGGGRYDIVNAGNNRLGGEHLTYKIRFAADMADAGYLARTISEEGKQLVAFHWAPVQWDEPMEHYTVTVSYPLEYPAETGTREEVEQLLLQNDFATEPWMNENYLIDYRVNVLDSVPRAQVLLHKDNPSQRYKFEIQQYISENLFDEFSVHDNTPPVINKPNTHPKRPNDTDFISPQPNRSAERMTLLIVFLVLILGILLLVGRKHRSMVNARLTYKDVQWARDDWVPPKLEVASFRKDGAVATDLDEAEAGLFIGIPYKTILSVIMYKLFAEGFLEEVSATPLRVKQIKDKDLSSLTEYEKLMYYAAEDGEFNERELESILKRLVDSVRAKTWNCDIDATKEYYKKQYEDAYNAETNDEKRYYGRYYDHHYMNHWIYWYVYNNGIHGHYR